MKLELKHLAPYLPYKMLFTFGTTGNTVVLEMEGLAQGEINNSYHWWKIETNDIKPLLIPLSVLMDRHVAILHFEDDSELLGEDWTAHAKAKMFVESGQVDIISSICEPYIFWEKLFENHFDVFGLIPAGLALNKLEVTA